MSPGYRWAATRTKIGAIIMDIAGIHPHQNMRSGAPSPARHAHSVQFYDDGTALVSRVSDFTSEALHSGGTAVVIATPAHRDAIAARLVAAGHDLARARQTGRYTSLDAARTLANTMVNGQVDELRFDAVIGGPVRQATALAARTGGITAVFGELVALLALEGDHEAAITMEGWWNTLSRRHGFALHCTYPMHAFSQTDDGDVLGRICDAHTDVVPAESYTTLHTPDEQSRQIVLLQQKASALEQEVIARARAEEALQAQYRELQAALIAREEFLAVAAHELRTPMTGLRGNAQMLRRSMQQGREVSRERMKRSLDTIENLSLRLNHLITRLLDASQIEAGMLRLAPARTDLVALVRSAMDHQPAHDGHMVEFDGPDRLDLVVDAVRIEQVIANLIDNSIRYSPDGGTVSVKVEDYGDEGIELSVTDTGPGIPPDQREAVFTSYRQGGSAERFAGIGLGLFVSRQIVELHGGAMHIEDPADHPGTRIVITLPSAASSTRTGESLAESLPGSYSAD
ncbi:MAG TPA: ATP-binding protein [Thermomicrobiales bacterium]|nr:ATP-binding protein [Thermomicrobiales bacterium]